MQCKASVTDDVTWRANRRPPPHRYVKIKKEMERLILLCVALPINCCGRTTYRCVLSPSRGLSLFLTFEFVWFIIKGRENNNLCRPSRFEFIIPFSLVGHQQLWIPSEWGWWWRRRWWWRHSPVERERERERPPKTRQTLLPSSSYFPSPRRRRRRRKKIPKTGVTCTRGRPPIERLFFFGITI